VTVAVAVALLEIVTVKADVEIAVISVPAGIPDPVTDIPTESKFILAVVKPPTVADKFVVVKEATACEAVPIDCEVRVAEFVTSVTVNVTLPSEAVERTSIAAVMFTPRNLVFTATV
jgi:hypothetical protein